mmetsp:Transcript_33859/g.52190  ORF Transcript_33859/g.52190 Transcript_33859/m.52190 type:complete len:124 (+) Transcript_33859:3068-3439(+)
MYRKIICLFVAVFLNDAGIVVQALVLLVLLVVFMQLNNAMRPFGTRALNEVEDFSLITQIFTIYCGLFFISSKDGTLTDDSMNSFYMTKGQEYFFLVVIISMNSFFIILWFVKFVMALKTMIR